MSQIADILLIISMVLFFTGILAGILSPLRRGLKMINTKLRLRHLFYGSFLVFIIAFAFGWKCFKAGFMEGYCQNINSAETITSCQAIEQYEVLEDG